MKAALIVPAAVSTDLAAVAVEAVPAIWTARLRTDHVVIFRVNGSKISNAVVEEAAASGVTVLVVEDSAVVIALVAEVASAASAVAAASADSAAVGAAEGNY